MENKACVYALRHNVTKKTYVGCSRNVQRRIQQHIDSFLTYAKKKREA